MTVSLFTQKVSVTAYAFLNNPLFALALLAVMGIIIWGGAKCTHLYNTKESALADEATLGNRLFCTYIDLCKEPERRLDIRTYNQQNVTSHFLSSCAFANGGAFDRLNKGRYGLLNAVGGGIGAVFTGFVYVFACLKAWAGAFAIGSVTQYVGAVTSLSGNIGAVLEYADQIRNNHRFLKLTYELLDTKNEMYQGSLTTEKRADRQYEVEFRDVSFYKDAPFIILDEPTAALDPIAEAEIYSKFNDIAGDKTAIYISHRLSSCKFCDEIAVFCEGKVIQQGSHTELVADEGGKYFELWHAQAQYYTA